MATQRADYVLDLSGGYCLPPEEGVILILQNVTKKIATEAGVYPIYSDDYGVKIVDLIGKDPLFVEMKLKERIKNAVLSVEGVERVERILTTAVKDGLQAELALKISGKIYEIKEVQYNV